MTDYTKAVNFAAKDDLPSGDTNKVIRGTEINTEFNNIAAAVNSKANTTTVATKQDTLVSGTNIKTVGGVTLLGPGNIPLLEANTEIISTSTTAVASTLYIFTATLTLTLPASPLLGDRVSFANRSGTTTPVIARNSQPIMGVAEDLTVDSENYFGTLVYADATRGWIFI